MLTPGHFLIFRALKAPPRTDISKAKLSSLRRWQLVKRLFYFRMLYSITTSKIKMEKSETVKVGDIVLIRYGIDE